MLPWINVIRNWMYDVGIFPSWKMRRPVISVGNLSVGGSGKTEFVRLIADYLIKKGKKVLIVSRGYKAQKKGIYEVGLDYVVADEPYLLKRFVPQAYVFVGRKREDVIHFAYEKYPQIDIVILDDGFQYRRVKRDIDIVLLTPYDKIFREGFSSLKRADIVVVNKVKDLEEALILEEKVNRYFRGIMPVCRYKLNMKVESDIPSAVVCGIALPWEFISGVKRAGVKVEKEFIFGDHYWFKYADIERMISTMKKNYIYRLYTTEKDWVKMESFKDLFELQNIEVEVVGLEVEFLRGKGEFFRVIDERLGLDESSS